MFEKRDGCRTIAEVVIRNTKMNLDDFLNPPSNPYIHNLSEAVSLLKNHAGPVHIVGDYDVDGICATTIMAYGLHMAGIEADTRLPKRFSEGYGLSEKIIDEIESGVVLTVDNGIAAKTAIEKAKRKGLCVIVTDHHLPPRDKNGNKILPPADIIVDPSAEEKSAFHGYCGAGIAYRFVQELLSGKDCRDLIVLASIATVTDVVPLVGPNHELLKAGLKYINTGYGVPGLRKLLEEIHLTEHITEEDYGFKIGPILNAAGRLYDNGADKVLELMKSSRNNARLPWEANRLIKTNDRRKELLNESLTEAEKCYHGERPIVMCLPECGQGIIGLVAGRLSEEHNCPAICFTDIGHGCLKGSGRSIPGIDLKAILDQIQDLILGYGGHDGAAGLSIRKNNFPRFREAFINACGPIRDRSDTVYYDLDLGMQSIDYAVDEMKRYAPFGKSNPKISFRIHNFPLKPELFRKVGNDKHFMMRDERCQLIGFGLAPEFDRRLEKLDCFPKTMDVVGYLSESWYNGKMNYRMEATAFEL